MEAPSAAFSTDAHTIPSGTKPVLVAGYEGTRRSVTITADDDNAGDVYVVASPSGAKSQGIRIVAGRSLTLGTAAAVYALAPTGGVVYVVSEIGSIG
jgi:hypothetical protein